MAIKVLINDMQCGSANSTGEFFGWLTDKTFCLAVVGAKRLLEE
ncbi:hypothetical protein [Pseudanabaena sp. PCC 6802]|nr:hypothetical protein [Pseudanabaena sp. PCC 6802]